MFLTLTPLLVEIKSTGGILYGYMTVKPIITDVMMLFQGG